MAQSKGILQIQKLRHGLNARMKTNKQKADVFGLRSIRISDAKTTPNPLQANYMSWAEVGARAGAGHSLVNCSA